jgi:hypothetical protein
VRLLKHWGKQHDLIFLAEYPLKTATKTNINVDGALLHELRMPMGYWEAKDANDDLNSEVVKKLKKATRKTTSSSATTAPPCLSSTSEEVLRCDMTDTAQAMEKLLKLFFGFERQGDRRFPRRGGAVQGRPAHRAASPARP